MRKKDSKNSIRGAGIPRARLNSPAREGLAYVCNFN
jgi:hypothetical protein